MSMVTTVRKSIGAQVSLKLAVVMLALTALAGTFITLHQTKQMEQLTLEKARLAAVSGARHYGTVMENAIDAEILSINDVFDRNYVLIKGYDWGQSPKYHTRYDAVTDAGLLVFQDKLLDQQDFIFAIGVDENGYVPTHNAKYQMPITGVPETDRTGNRSKRMFNDAIGLAAARNLESSLLQSYKRDTGETTWDVSAPIYVKGKHWGAFRLGVSMERITAHQRALVLVLAGIFALFVVVTIATMFLVVKGAMKPVVALTAAAEQISLGEALDAPIKSKAIDEVGQLTKAVDRLRASMKAAMSRLGQ